jgi:hypothetical protein
MSFWGTHYFSILRCQPFGSSVSRNACSSPGHVPVDTSEKWSIWWRSAHAGRGENIWPSNLSRETAIRPQYNYRMEECSFWCFKNMRFRAGGLYWKDLQLSLTILVSNFFWDWQVYDSLFTIYMLRKIWPAICIIAFVITDSESFEQGGVPERGHSKFLGRTRY